MDIAEWLGGAMEIAEWLVGAMDIAEWLLAEAIQILESDRYR